MIVTNRDSSIKRLIKIVDDFKILINFIITIFYKLRNKIDLLIDKNFMFIFQRLKLLKFEGGIFSHIVDIYIKIIQIRNNNSKTVYIFKNNKINVIQKYEKKCYLTN